MKMARYINADKFLDKLLYMGYMDEQKSEIEEVANNMIEEAIPQAEYEARLKADIVAMLEELKKEIIELPFPQREPEYMQGYSYCQMNILDYVIQEKINNLKDKNNRKSMKNG